MPDDRLTAAAPLIESIAAVLEPAHPRSTGPWIDGFTATPTEDGAATKLTYLVTPQHRADTGVPHRWRAALQDCAVRLADAGHPVSRVSIHLGYRFDDALIVFPAPAPEPQQVDPAVCWCEGRGCARAQARVRAVRALTTSGNRAVAALLSALEECAKHPVIHCIGGPESTAAALDAAREALVPIPAVDSAAVLADPACEGCSARDCRESGALAQSALARAEVLAAVHLVSSRAAHLVLDRAHQQLTPGMRWRATAVHASERLFGVLATARAALHQPAEPDRRPWRGERVSLLPLWRRRRR